MRGLLPLQVSAPGSQLAQLPAMHAMSHVSVVTHLPAALQLCARSPLQRFCGAWQSTHSPASTQTVQVSCLTQRPSTQRSESLPLQRVRPSLQPPPPPPGGLTSRTQVALLGTLVAQDPQLQSQEVELTLICVGHARPQTNSRSGTFELGASRSTHKRSLPAGATLPQAKSRKLMNSVRWSLGQLSQEAKRPGWFVSQVTRLGPRTLHSVKFGQLRSQE